MAMKTTRIFRTLGEQVSVPPRERDLRFLDPLARLAADFIEHKRTEKTIRRRNRFAEALSRLFREALACETEARLGAICLTVAEDLTHRQSGFMAEIKAEGLSNPGF